MGKEADLRIKKFFGKVKSKLKVELALLFGSRARGDNLENSDYDVLIVSSDFEGKGFNDRVLEIYDCWDYLPLDIEPLCYTPAEFVRMKKRIGIVQQALEEGIEI